VSDSQSSFTPTRDYQEWRQSAWQLWKGPSIAWLVLIALFAANFFLAYLPLGAGNLALSLAIAALMVAVLTSFLMGLRNSKALIRIVAGAGLFWTSLMFVLTFCDFLSRHY
jgi:cytochrome c oxidase subunit IV